MNRYSHSSIGACPALCRLSISAVHAQVDGSQLLDGYAVTAAERARLENGAVLAFSDGEYESTKRELSADAMVLVDSNFSDVLEVLTESATLIPSHVMLDHAVISSEADFAGVKFTEAEFREVEDLFEAKPGKDFNFSNEEYAFLRQRLNPHRKSDPAGKIAAASDAMRALLTARYNEYRANGLSGIEGYTRSRRQQVDVGSELRLTTETFKPFESEFPEFYRVMHDYPATAECCEHYFRWLKVRIRKRPTFALAHTMIQKTDDYILLTERYYYAVSTLNSLQVTLAWLHYADDTYMGLAMSASTDLLDSMIGRMLRPIGRNKAKDMVTDIMEDIKAELEDDSDATGSSN